MGLTKNKVAWNASLGRGAKSSRWTVGVRTLFLQWNAEPNRERVFRLGGRRSIQRLFKINQSSFFSSSSSSLRIFLISSGLLPLIIVAILAQPRWRRDLMS